MRYRYAGAEVVVDDRFALLAAVRETVEAILARIRVLIATEGEGSVSATDRPDSSAQPDESGGRIEQHLILGDLLL